ncbi:putative phosphodiesterase/alkaline phosphatase D [Calothrix sp. NIES-4071]|nr:putative phosphodiesterase/alkaline phosphatase D [Calothrix sp. NIES-4071]BAZ59190.1 putative phosphodiesterase/alkaline phosphatase D [Calothrix sp. NIES-4105]
MFRLKHLTVIGLAIITTAILIVVFPSISGVTTVSFNGVASGDATQNSIILWTRAFNTATNQGIISNLTAQIATDSKFRNIVSSTKTTTDPKRDYTAKLDVKGLKSGTRYYYRFVAKNKTSPVGTFKTAPTATASFPIRFAFSGDADGQWRPYPSTQNFDKLNLDYFILLGDAIYETKSAISEATADPFTNTSQALLDYRRKYREQLEPVKKGGFTGLQKLFAANGNYTLLDNHELANKQFINGGAPAGTPEGKGVDAANSQNDVNTANKFINKTEGFKTLVKSYSEYEPIREKTISITNDPRTDKTQKLYFAQQWGANSIFINLDDRSYRDIRLKTEKNADDIGARADNSKRTMLGKTQLSWFKETLLDVTRKRIPWKIVAISSPIDEIGSDSGKSWYGNYRAERNEILKFIDDNNIENVVFLSTDDHQNRVNDLTYLADFNNPNTRKVSPNAFTIVAGPIGASGPDKITKHDFATIQFLTDGLVTLQKAKGINPIGLDAKFPGLQKVYREGHPQADQYREPIDFFSPDTFNYVTLDIGADGKTLSVNTYGINSYAANTFPEPEQTDSPRRILGFEIQKN